MSILSLVSGDLRADIAHRSSAMARTAPSRALTTESEGVIEAGQDTATADTPEQDPSSTALDALVKYIPTEVVTLYLAAVSATSAIQAFLPSLNRVAIYWVFAVLTPLLYLMLFINGRIANKLSVRPEHWSKFPLWNMFAATVAYLVWALAVPDNPFIHSDAQAIAAGFGAVFVSFFLSLLSPLSNYLLDKLAPKDK